MRPFPRPPRRVGPSGSSAYRNAGRAPTNPRWVVHLPFTAADLPAARRFAAALARSVTFLPEVDAGQTTVSAEADQGVREPVFCDLPLPDRRRCARRTDHDGPCSARPPR